jgi:hypothetical protein
MLILLHVRCFSLLTFNNLGVPEPPRLCELRNDSVMEVICQAGYDGGLQQHFVLEAIGATSTYFNNLDSTRSTHEILDNEISTMNDQVSSVYIYNCVYDGSVTCGRVEKLVHSNHPCDLLFLHLRHASFKSKLDKKKIFSLIYIFFRKLITLYHFMILKSFYAFLSLLLFICALNVNLLVALH